MPTFCFVRDFRLPNKTKIGMLVHSHTLQYIPLPLPLVRARVEGIVSAQKEAMMSASSRTHRFINLAERESKFLVDGEVTRAVARKTCGTEQMLMKTTYGVFEEA